MSSADWVRWIHDDDRRADPRQHVQRIGPAVGDRQVVAPGRLVEELDPAVDHDEPVRRRPLEPRRPWLGDDHAVRRIRLGRQGAGQAAGRVAQEPVRAGERIRGAPQRLHGDHGERGCRPRPRRSGGAAPRGSTRAGRSRRGNAAATSGASATGRPERPPGDPTLRVRPKAAREPGARARAPRLDRSGRARRARSTTSCGPDHRGVEEDAQHGERRRALPLGDEPGDRGVRREPERVPPDLRPERGDAGGDRSRGARTTRIRPRPGRRRTRSSRPRVRRPAGPRKKLPWRFAQASTSSGISQTARGRWSRQRQDRDEGGEADDAEQLRPKGQRARSRDEPGEGEVGRPTAASQVRPAADERPGRRRA